MLTAVVDEIILRDFNEVKGELNKIQEYEISEKFRLK